MRTIATYQNQSVLVLGLGKSGVNATKLLLQLGAKVTVNDGQDQEDTPAVAELRALGATVITGSHPVALFEEGFHYLCPGSLCTCG